ncbi:hypothetical protein ACFFNY_06315 [Paenibacillus hodogayensis]|uniref:GIY-YIG domain-containing protein n=1 Tax=Paenibacillus hodogayensis TaxID=279208 RepID=A0ABV5VSB2_9BACL
MEATKHVHIYWEGPFTLEQMVEIQDNTRDYGLYQIYGGHPVYGSNVLLYIGKADRQTFGTRISQENWIVNRNAGALNIYIGRLAGQQQPTDDEWSREIALAEKILIFAHAPACNSQFISLTNEEGLESIHILNWGSHRDLMAEVSGRRWTSKYQNEIHQVYKYVY